MARIIFLGTSGDSSVTGRQLRASGGFILQIGELQFHVDPGPGSLVKAKEFNINPRATSVILSTHNHLNHSHDINAVVDAMTLGGLDKKGVLIAAAPVVHGNEKYLPAISHYHGSCLERIISLSPEEKAAVEDIEIKATPAFHSQQGAIGFRITAPRFTLGYTGDTTFAREVANAFEGCSILILNVTFPGDVKSDSHLSRDSAAKIIQHVKPKLAILTHFGFDMLRADPVLEARFLQVNTGVQTIAAQDGMTISPAAYTS